MAVTERLAILLETVGSSAVVKDLEKISGATRGLGDKLTATSGFFSKFGAAGEQMSGVLASAIPGMAVAAGGALVGFAVSSVSAFQDVAQAALQVQRATGATAEQASALVAAFDDMGISADTGATAMFQLGKRIETNAEGLAKYGVEAARDASGNVDLAETLKDVADAYQNTTDPAERAALVNAAFGKSGQALLPILEQGRAGIEAMYSSAAATGQILSQEDIQASEDYRLAVDELSDAFRKLQIEGGKAVVPLLTDLATAISKTIEWTDKIITLDGALDDVGKKSDYPGIGGFLDRIKNKILGWDQANEEVAASNEGVGESTKDVADRIAEEEKKMDAL
jgi:hypothetical protein